MIGLPKYIYLNTKWTSSKIFSRQEELDLRRCPTTRPRGDEERPPPPPPPPRRGEGGGQSCAIPQEVLMKEVPARNNKIVSGDLNNPKRPPVWLRRWRYRSVMEPSLLTLRRCDEEI